MYTQCPHCQTCFRISEAHLKVANGKVRCGSCQEVFDATQYLFKNLTDREPITDYKLPTSPPSAQPRLPPNETEHIDLTTPSRPSPQAVEKILRERKKAPDQSHFMESTVGNDRYNDLDKMGPISIPGNIDFGDSIIKFEEDEKPPVTAKKKTAESRTPYEDFENKEAAATTADHESIKDFYAQVDAQLTDQDSRSQLDKDIDELLAFANGLNNTGDLEKPVQAKRSDSKSAKAKPTDSGVKEEFDLQALAEFEKELEATNSGVFTAKNLQKEQTASKERAVNTLQPSAKVKTKPETKEASVPTSDNVSIAAETSNETQEHAFDMETLPSADEDIPLALRRSLDSLNQMPRRSLGQTLLLLLVILILIGGFGFQFILFRNVELAHMFPKLIPELSKVCDKLPCRYSGMVDVSQIKLLNRDVRSHPTQPNALLISAAFVNQAPFDQPYPIIQITMYDLGGNVVASRRFTPQEYLEQMYNRFLLMESGTPVHITLAVLDPGKDAINFEFSFQ